MKYYVGVSDSGHSFRDATIFRSEVEPDEGCHPINHLYAWGGYSTRKKAIEVAMYQGYRIVTRRDKPAPIWDGTHNYDFPMEVYA